jgi:hypothetical protein
MAKKWTEAKDRAYDKARGIKEGSKRDNALDRKRGVPIRPPAKVGSGNASHTHGPGCGCDAGRGVGLKVGAGADLSMAQRKKLPSSSFALPGKGSGPSGKGSGSYPIPDRSHAQNALARVSQHGSPAQKKAVRSKVKAKFGMGGK